mgnify:CR=1 FL=1
MKVYVRKTRGRDITASSLTPGLRTAWYHPNKRLRCTLFLQLLISIRKHKDVASRDIRNIFFTKTKTSYACLSCNAAKLDASIILTCDLEFLRVTHPPRNVPIKLLSQWDDLSIVSQRIHPTYARPYLIKERDGQSLWRAHIRISSRHRQIQRGHHHGLGKKSRSGLQVIDIVPMLVWFFTYRSNGYCLTVYRSCYGARR